MFQQRPSSLLGITDPGAALDVDLKAWDVLTEEDARAGKDERLF
jgi:hypothetical protein